MTINRTAHVVLIMSVMLALATTGFAQSPLSLEEALRRARAHNLDAAAARVSEREAAERVTQARAGYLPRVDFTGSWQRGNNPAFVFSSLLAQRRLVPDGFAPETLNHPAATDNFRAAFSFEQSLFNRATSANVRAASIGRHIAATTSQLVGQDLTFDVTEAFGRVLMAAASVRSAASAVEMARADRERTANRRDAGLVTDADVLQMDVHLARTIEHQVRAIADERIARVRLNQLMGEPLSTAFSIDLTPPVVLIETEDPAGLEGRAIASRPEVELARQQQRLSQAAVDVARSAFLPQIVAQGTWELNGGAWNARSPSWAVGAVARINLLQGFADKARLAEARQLAERRSVEVAKADVAVRLDVQVAIARLEAARASEAAGRAAAEWARASHRIVADRYECGLADVAALLRSADAVQEAEALAATAVVDVLIAGANLQRATGQS